MKKFTVALIAGTVALSGAFCAQAFADEMLCNLNPECGSVSKTKTCDNFGTLIRGNDGQLRLNYRSSPSDAYELTPVPTDHPDSGWRCRPNDSGYWLNGYHVTCEQTCGGTMGCTGMPSVTLELDNKKKCSAQTVAEALNGNIPLIQAAIALRDQYKSAAPKAAAMNNASPQPLVQSAAIQAPVNHANPVGGTADFINN